MIRRSSRAPARGKRAAPGSAFTRVRALLAGALVLGVGGTLTLAAWTDTETARGVFAASKFGIQGSTDGTTFSDHPTTGPAALAFAVAPNAMSPGTTTYARFTVRTLADTNVAGSVTLSGAAVTGTGLGTHLRYGVRTIPAGSACNATTFGTGAVVVANNSTLATAGTGSQPLAVAAGSPVNYCFAVTLPEGTPNEAQGLTATANWTLTGTSAS